MDALYAMNLAENPEDRKLIVVRINALQRAAQAFVAASVRATGWVIPFCQG